MTQKPKHHRQPLGGNKQLDRILQNIREEEVSDQTRRLTIVYAKTKLQVDIPSTWTINKVKCMMTVHFVMLDFDKFQFQCNNFLIPGKTAVSDLPDNLLIVTQADCLKSFDDYYVGNMKKVFKKYNINASNSLYPITHPALSFSMTKCIPNERKSNIQEIPIEGMRARNDQAPQGNLLLNIFRIIGIAIMSNIIFSFASYGQIAILCGITLLYYLIDEYVKQNDRRRRREQERQAQRQEQKNRRREEFQERLQQLKKKREKLTQKLIDLVRQQQKPQNQINNQQDNDNQKLELPTQNQPFLQEQQQLRPRKRPQRKIIKAKFILWVAFIFETLYCYILSIFPNWTVETHLHANQKKMNKVMDDVKRLDPEASDLIKKWEIQQDQYDEDLIEKPKNE